MGESRPLFMPGQPTRRSMMHMYKERRSGYSSSPPHPLLTLPFAPEMPAMYARKKDVYFCFAKPSLGVEVVWSKTT